MSAIACLSGTLSWGLIRTGDWMIRSGAGIIDQGIRKSNVLIDHICHGCKISRFSPDFEEVRGIINQSSLYTTQTVNQLNTILSEALNQEVVGEGICKMGAVCQIAGVALGAYAVYKLAGQVVNYLKS